MDERKCLWLRVSWGYHTSLATFVLASVVRESGFLVVEKEERMESERTELNGIL